MMAMLLLALIIVLLVFFMLINKGKIGEEKLTAIGFSENNLLLLSYLRTPLSYNGEEILMSDLIVLEDKDKIEEETKKILDTYCNGKCGWKIELEYTDDKIVVSNGDFIETLSSDFELTGFDGNIQVKFQKGVIERIMAYSKYKILK